MKSSSNQRPQSDEKLKKQHARRISPWAGGFFGLTIIILLLPTLISEQTLKNWIAKDLSNQTGLNVEIGQAKLSWLDGVTISDVQLTNPESKAVILASSITLPFEPISFCTSKKISFIRFDNIKIQLPVTGDIDSLPQNNWNNSKPFNLPITRIQLSNVTVTLVWPDGYKNRVQIPWLECINNTADNTIKYSSQARFECIPKSDGNVINIGRLNTKGEFNLAVEENQQCVAGEIKSQWQDLDLSAWRLVDIDKLNLADLRGKNSGRLTFKIFPDFHFNWQLESNLYEFLLQQKNSSETNSCDHANFKINGSYDPVTGQIVLNKLNVTSDDIKLKGKMSGQLGSQTLLLNAFDSKGTFDSAVLPTLTSSLSKSLGPQSEINGPCEFDFHWQRNQVGYLVNASINADNVTLIKPNVIEKHRADPLHWSMSLHVDKKNWPWMIIDQFDIKFGEITGVGSGRLPMVAPNDDFSWWLGESKRAGTFQLNLEVPGIENVGKQICALRQFNDSADLSGDMTIQLGYKGDDDVGRFDITAELCDQATLNWKDYFVKPVGEKLTLDLQCYWPWNTNEPQTWLYLFGRCGGTEIKTPNHPMIFVWSFSENPEHQPQIDIRSDMILEISGLNQLLANMPKNKAQIQNMKLTGKTSLQLDAAMQATLLKTRWQPNHARGFFSLNADQTDIEIPNQFSKKSGTPLRWNCNYDYNKTQTCHNITSELVWQNSHSTLEIHRLGENSPTVKGKCDFTVNKLSDILSAAPLLTAKLPKSLNLTGTITGQCNWITDQTGSKVNWKCSADEATIDLNNKPIKSSAELANFSGEVILPKLAEGEIPTYTISKLRTNIGESFIDLKHGSFTPPAKSNNEWLEMIGVEPWLVWRDGPLESFDLTLTGKLFAESSCWNINPNWCDLKQQCDIVGYVDFDAESRLKNNQLKTTLLTRLDDLGFSNCDCFTKTPGTPSELNLTINLWPDSNEQTIYYAQIDPFILNLGNINLAGQGYSEIHCPNAQNLSIEKALAKLDLQVDDLKELKKIVPKLKDVNADGYFSTQLTLKRENNNTILGPSKICFGDAKVNYENYPANLNASIFFSGDSVSCDRLTFEAGISSLESDWYLVLNDKSVTGNANIHSDHFDVDQITAYLEKIISSDDDATTANPTTQPSTKKSPYQDEILAEFQPWREIAAKSNLLLNLDSTWFQVTDPRNDLRFQLSDLRCQLNLKPENHEGKSAGNLRFWSRVADGLFYGVFALSLDEENPTLQIASSLDTIKMTKEYQPLVADFFPGLNVEERYSTHEKISQKLFTTKANSPNFPVGYGSMIFTQGYMVGRAGPSWIVQIFPGLNFTRYNFERMYNWYSKQNDGVTHNNMIFVGSPWNLYIEGESYPDQTLIYEIGVDILARYESEYWSKVGQGRVPIFITSGKIVNCKMTDQKVKYVPLHEVIYRILVKNNAIAGAYRFLMKDRQ